MAKAEKQKSKYSAKVISVNVARHIDGDSDPDKIDQRQIDCLSDAEVRKCYINGKVHSYIAVHRLVDGMVETDYEQKVERLLTPLK